MHKVFEIKHLDKKTSARTGVIHTKKGPIKTPFFMPVATKTSVKYIASDDLMSMKAEAIISNTFVLHLRPGEKLIKKMGGIGKFMNYSGINVTDSGGFQMYSDALYLGSTKEGVFFKDPWNGNKVFLTPQKDMEIQIDLDSDIAMCLDSMPLLHQSKKEIKEAVMKTALWAARCKKHHDKLQSDIPKEKRQLLFCISQGGVHKDLREISANSLKKINFDGFAIGGLALGETKEEEYKQIEIHKKIVPKDKPVYLMGAGHPIEILEAISRGVDMFDSRFPTQNARRGTIFTHEGKIRITNKKYELSSEPLDKDCDCFVCKNYTKSYIRYQLSQEEGVGFRLSSYHNLYFLVNLCKKARIEIEKGTFSKFLSNMRKHYENTDKEAKDNFNKYTKGK
jgi:queuine tRNA-ribosyltransferase